MIILYLSGFGTLYAQDKSGNEPSVDSLSFPVSDYPNSKLTLDQTLKEAVHYDVMTGKYIVVKSLGDYVVERLYFSPKEYEAYKLKKEMDAYFQAKLSGQSGEDEEAQKDLLPTFYVKSGLFENIFGGNEIKVDLQGSINARLGVNYQRIEDPRLSENNRGNINFEFDQQIAASVVAKLGKRLNVTMNYDTDATFDFQNLVKLEYTPKEDDILRKLEIGNVNFPVQNSLIPGAQALFGAKAEMQFGKTYITGVLAQQNSETRRIETDGQGSLNEFELKASDYDENRHFFLAQYFRDNYNRVLENYPLLNTGIQVSRIEVWVTNRQSTVENVRNIVAMVDLAESGQSKDNRPNITNPLVTENAPNPKGEPSNEVNELNELLDPGSGIREIGSVPATLSPYGMQVGKDYSIMENARRLEENEYTFHPQLGFVSLTRRLEDGEVLAVAYQFTDETGQVYQVGEFSTDGVSAPQNLVMKMLKSEVLYTQDPIWNLMMKNIYALGAFDINTEDFRLELLYKDDKTGVAVNSLQNAKTDGVKDQTLLNLFHLDRLDRNQFVLDGGDGIFDFVPGVTFDPQKGLLMMTQTDPFGFDLQDALVEEDDVYIFSALYNETKQDAKNNYQEQDKYRIKGYFKAARSSGISLGAFNVPRGSVTVTAGGRTLVEGVDYVVDYQLGEVQIINPSIESSGQAIDIALESVNTFAQQTRSFMGLDIQREVSDDLILGASVLRVNEKPLTQKVGIGSEPVNNTVFGLNFAYAKEVPFLTTFANKLPFVDTEVPSNVSVRGDAAFLKPSAPRGIELNGEPTAYLDDFEGAQVPIEIGLSDQWYLASNPDRFSDAIDDPTANFSRARMAWYTIDQLFYGTTGIRPSNIDDDEISRAEVRRVSSLELFPNQELDATVSTNLRTFDLAYYPDQRGSYNYDLNVDSNGRLVNPEDRWAGVMRPLSINDFDQNNVSYLEFWIQDPYTQYSIDEEEGLAAGIDPQNPTNQVGDLYINLGNVSEDILKDNRKGFENGLPEDGSDFNTISTQLARVATEQKLIYTFEENDQARLNQDLGFDGMDDQRELELFGDNSILGQDPSSDNYQFYRGTELDNQGATILQRYFKYNNTEGNSPTLSMSPESYSISATTYPDVEDINRDNTMNTLEGYFEYKISLNKQDLQVGQNNIVDEKNVSVGLPNGETKSFRWLQFRIPLRDPDSKVGSIQDFHSIRFMRMYMTGFKMPVVLRFARMELVRGEWRRYLKTIDDDPQMDLSPEEQRSFTEGVVNIEENENRYPIPYVIPPGIQREQLQGTVYVLQQNEQSLSLKVNDLPAGETRALFKNVNYDMRLYKHIDMFIHAEGVVGAPGISQGDLKAIIRFGADLTENYYQIEKDLEITDFSATTAEEIWPELNNLDAALDVLSKLKLDRYSAFGEDSSEWFAKEVASSNGSNYTIGVKGNPNLGNTQVMMLGVRNESPLPVNAEVWFDELRLSGFEQDGGWAGVLNADANIADFANFSLSAGMETTGFGSVDQSLSERSLEDVKAYDFVSNFNLGMLSPKKWRLQIPFNYGFSEEIRDPKYDQQYQDILFDDAKEVNPNSIYSRSKFKRKNISFLNVKKGRDELEKAQFYDIENFMVSYSFSEAEFTDYRIESDLEQNVKSSANYSYSKTPDFISPFSKGSSQQGGLLAWLKAFNFNPWPSAVGVNANINRNYTSQKARSLVEDLPPLPELTQHRFLFNWDYNIEYDLSQSLSVNFKAANFHVNDQRPTAEIDDIFQDYFSIGRPDHYRQSLSTTYLLPFKYLPLMDFVDASYTYTADYDWQAASQSYVNQIGNTIQNANTHTLNSTLDMNTLYNRLGINKSKSTSKPKTKELKNAGSARANRQRVLEAQKQNKSKADFSFLKDLLTMVKDVKFSYAENNGSYLQGFIPNSGFLGSVDYLGSQAPGMAFAFGSQRNILGRALTEGWLISRSQDDPYYSRSYNRTQYNKADFNATLSPVKSFEIELYGSQIYTRNRSQQVDIIDEVLNTDIPLNQNGNFSTSFLMFKTTTQSDENLFETFKSNRSVIAERLSKESGQDISGYGNDSQDVMLPAFVAAYSGKDAETVSLNAFRASPLPNWRVNFRSLMLLPWFKDNFANFTLSHNYASFYTISNFNANLLYDKNNPLKTDISGNYIPELNYANLSLVEEFSPLIKVDMRMKNSFSLSAEYHTDRMYSLNFNNNTTTEINGKEYVVGLGYRVKNIAFTTRSQGRSKRFIGDLNLRADISFRDNLTLIRAVETENNQITGGQSLFSFKFVADYALTRNIQTSLYYDQSGSKYAVSTTFPRKNINAGFSLTYNLGN